MTAITIPLSDDRFTRLKEFAEAANVSPEELVRLSVEEWLNRPEEGFTSAAKYVLDKNVELYRGLAR